MNIDGNLLTKSKLSVKGHNTKLLLFSGRRGYMLFMRGKKRVHAEF